MDKMETYAGWKSAILIYVETEGSLWRSIGEWLYPKKGVIRANFDHLCEENYKRGSSDAGAPDKCKACGTEIPDGIKMIALLEKL